MELTNVGHAVDIAHAALLAIESQGGTVPATSPLRSDIDFLVNYHQASINQNTYGEAHNFEDLPRRLRRQVGALEVFKRVVALDQSGRLSAFKPALQHFKDAGVSLASPFTDYPDLSQNAKSHTRLLYEFYLASSITLGGSLSTEIAGTKDASQKNPDILINNFAVGGIACKVIACKNDMTMLDRLMEGAEQIEKSSCQAGIVALDVRQCVDQEVLIAETEDGYRTYLAEEIAVNEVKAKVAQIGDRILKAMSPHNKEIYIKSTTRATFVLTVQGLAIIETEQGKIPTSISYARVFPVSDLLANNLNSMKAELEIANWFGIPTIVTV